MEKDLPNAQSTPEIPDGDDPFLVAASTDASSSCRPTTSSTNDNYRNVMFFKIGCRQTIQDHRGQCQLEEDSCRTCKIDEDSFQQWDQNHRGGQLHLTFGDESTASIAAAKGWITNPSPSSSFHTSSSSLKRALERSGTSLDIAKRHIGVTDVTKILQREAEQQNETNQI